MASASAIVAAVTMPTRRTEPDGDRVEVAPIDGGLGEHGRDALRQQLAVPLRVDDDALGERAALVVDECDRDRRRRGVQAEDEHVMTLGRRRWRR
jgi:hypothetical protein